MSAQLGAIQCNRALLFTGEGIGAIACNKAVSGDSRVMAITNMGTNARAPYSVAFDTRIVQMTHLISIQLGIFQRVRQKVQVPRMQTQPIFAPHPTFQTVNHPPAVLESRRRVVIEEKRVPPIHPINYEVRGI